MKLIKSFPVFSAIIKSPIDEKLKLDLIRCITESTIVDAVLVTRCKDCCYFRRINEQHGRCIHPSCYSRRNLMPNCGYCYYGEKHPSKNN